jgi:hypothetical protein
VVPLTGAASANQDLLGAVADSPAAINPRAATRVLVKGEALTPPAGRSDDFRWPRRGVAAFGTDPTVAVTTDPTPAPAVATAPAPAIAAVSAPDKADNKSGTGKKTSGRAQPQQAQAEQPQRRQAPQQQPQRRRDDFGGGGFFGR